MAVCVVCGNEAQNNTMEVTGHGLRCAACTREAELRALQHGSDMSEHLTPQELEETARRAKSEMVGGVLLTLGALVATGISYAIGTRTVVIFVGAFFAGLGVVAHGWSVSRQATRSRERFPDAKVMSEG